VQNQPGLLCEQMLTPLSEWWCGRGSDNSGNLILHADNARPHKPTVSQQFMARKAMAIAAHPPFSPDLDPSDFYLFGHVKRLLGGESCETEERLVSAVKSIWIPRKVDFDQGFSQGDDDARAMC
jgi:hypothetical protein